MYVRNMGSNNRAGHGGFIKYCFNKEARSKYTFSINENGLGYWNVNGEKISEKEFSNLFPIGSINRGAVQLDTRQIEF